MLLENLMKILKNYEKAFHYLSKANQLKFDKKGSNLKQKKKPSETLLKFLMESI